MKTEKQAIPVFLDQDNKPIAGIFFITGKRVICSIKEMDEDEIISLYERTNVKLSTVLTRDI